MVSLIFAVAALGAQAQEPVRTWTNKEGKTLKARMLSYDETREAARIKRKDGKVFELYYDALSEADQDYIDKYIVDGVVGKRRAAIAPSSKGRPRDNSIIPAARLALGEMAKNSKYLPGYDIPTIKKHWNAYKPDATSRKKTLVWIIRYMEATGDIDASWRDELLTYYLTGSTWRSQRDNSAHVFRNSSRNLKAPKRASGSWAKQWRIRNGKVVFSYPYHLVASFSDHYKTLSNTHKGTLKHTGYGL